MNRKTKFFSLLSLLCIMALYENCGSAVESFGIQSVSSSACDIELTTPFEQNIYPFFKTNVCNNCHHSGTAPFASENTSIAFSAFAQIGPTNIKNKISAGHNGANYSVLEPQLDQMIQNWSEAQDNYNTCKLDNTEPHNNSEKKTKPMTLNFFHPTATGLCGLDHHLENDITEYQKITWDLEESFGSDYKGVQLSIEILPDTTEFTCTNANLCSGATFFCAKKFFVRAPQLTTGDKNIHIKGLQILVENSNHSVTTFSHIDTNVNANETSFPLSSSNSSGLIDPNGNIMFSNETKWQIHFDYIQFD